MPKATAVSLLVNPTSHQAEAQMREMQEPARLLTLRLHVVKASTARELDIAFAALSQKETGALVVASDPLFISGREQIVALAARHAIPTIFAEPESVAAGGLMSYAASQADSFRQVGAYVGRILKGEKPADLPVLQPTKFELVINLKTAKAVGLIIPDRLIAIADEVIE